jgi:hypothetical protein
VPGYRPEVLEELARFGVRPRPTTPPRLVYDYLSDLYRYEIRRLRDRLLRGEFPKRDYSEYVVRLRQRYPLLSIQTRFWMI